MYSSVEVEKIINNSMDIAKRYKHEYVTVEHLLLSLVVHEPFYKLIDDYGSDVKGLKLDVETYLDKQSVWNVVKSTEIKPKKTTALERVFNRAFTQVLFSGRTYMQTIDLFLSIFNETNSHAAYFINKLGINKEHFVEFYNENYPEDTSTDAKTDKTSAKKILEKSCTNLNKLAKNNKIDPVIGRDNELDDIAQVLAKRNKSNILLVGDPGVGKTAIAEGLALKIVDNDVPEYLLDKTVYSLDVGSILAGSKYRGEFEEKVKEIIDSLVSVGNAVLFIDEAHQIKGAGNSGSGQGVDFANMIKPAIAKGGVKVIASTTWEEFNSSFEKDRALMRRFQLVSVDEPDRDTCIDILNGLKDYFESFHNAVIHSSAIESSVDLSIRHLTDKKLPDKAIDLIDSACAKQRQMGRTNINITKFNILEQISKQTRIPMDQLDNEKQNSGIINYESNIKQKLFGQNSAVDTVLEKIYVAKAGFKSDNKPIGSFLFLGPTGTGKTELAKLLSENLSMHMIRYDMSEFQEKHTVSKLVGAPPGYVGFDDSASSGGLLVDQIQKNPHCVLLFDEIEKAHPDVSNVLLQLMDEGFITGSNGKRADCRNTIVIMTSNLGASDNDRNAIGFGGDMTKSGEDDRAVKEFFKPEFRNRMDGVVKFNKLDKITMKLIVEKFLKELENQALEQEFCLEVSSSVIDHLIEQGFDSKMGARPLQRIINDKIKVPLSKKILFDNVPKHSTIKVIINNETIDFEIKIGEVYQIKNHEQPNTNNPIVLDQFKPK